MNSKKWIKIVLVLVVLVLPVFVGWINYTVDPYGYLSTNNKYSELLTRVNKPIVLNTKLYTNGKIYLIGTSRQMRVNPNLIHNYTNKEVRNINISGSTLSENLMIAKKVKQLGKNFIYGFDCFSLNEYRIKKFSELKSRYISYKNELSKSSFTLLHGLLNFDIIKVTIRHTLYQLLNKDLYFNDNKENITVYDYNQTRIINTFNEVSKKGNFTKFTLYPDKKILELAKLADEKDIFIIYPEYFFYYKMFQKYQNIEKSYFHAIKILVKNTKAKVWIFYGINKITTNVNNFDTDGWHFHPKIAKLIYNDVYSNKSNIGYLLTNDKVDEYLKNLHNQIQNYDLNKTIK